MEYTNIQWLTTAPIYVNFRKHHCPECKVQLNVVKESRILRPDSEDALKVAKRIGIHPQQIGERRSGKTKVVWKEFDCPQCNRRFTVNQMKQIEGIPL